MNRIKKTLMVGLIVVAISLTFQADAKADYPVLVQPAVAPTVVGYSVRRAGLFGQRVVMRPVVAPAIPVSTVTVSRPVVTVARPAVVVERPLVTVERPVVTVARPLVSVGYAPPVAAYYRPVVPVVTYRMPVTTYMIGN